LVVRRKPQSGQSVTSTTSRIGAAAVLAGGSQEVSVAHPNSDLVSVFDHLSDTELANLRLAYVSMLPEGSEPDLLDFAEFVFFAPALDDLDANPANGSRRRMSAGTVESQSILGVGFSGTQEVGLMKVNDSSPPTALQPPTPIGARPRRIRFSPEGDFLYVAVASRTAPNLQDEIRAFRVAPDGKLTLENTIQAGNFLTDIRVFPRGLAAATVSSNVRNEIRVYRREGASLTLDKSLETSPAGQIPSFSQLSIARQCGAVESTRIIVTEYQASRLGSLVYTPDQPAANPCVSLNQGRFEVRVDWSVPAENRSGVATATAITGDTGHFWFFDPANVELVVKVLDGRTINGNFWVYYGALTDVRYTITVTDTETGDVRTYVNPAGNQASAADVDAFDGSASTTLFDRAIARTTETATRSAALGALAAAALDVPVAATAADLWPERDRSSSSTCTATPQALCLTQGRFQVRVDWSAPGQGGDGNAVSLSADTGYFWFFDPANVELIVKVLDARVINGKFWVYYGALSDVEYTITVTDTVTGAQKTYFNPSGTLGSGADTSAF
jgi:hypothetical protein